MKHPLQFLFGYTRYKIPQNMAHEIVNLFGEIGGIYRNFTFSEGYAFFDVPLFCRKKFEKASKSRGLPVEADSRRGLPSLLWRYRHRYGIIAGGLIFLFIVTFSGMILWDIRVIGNTTLDADRVKEELEACGLSVGDLLWNINTPVLENRLLIESDDIAWISINIIGNVAEVEIREAVPEPHPEEDYLCSDVVASRDGVVEWFEDTRGNTVVSSGDTVKAGDVLVSGYYPETETVGARFTVAKGRVYARTEREFSVSIPLTYEKKIYTGREKCEKYFILFKKEVKFFGNSRNLYANCDTIDTVEYLELPHGVLLPFGVRTVRYLEYENTAATRSAETATELALYKLRCLMAEQTRDGMLTKKQMTANIREDSYELICHAEYIENIALIKETEPEQYLKKED